MDSVGGSMKNSQTESVDDKKYIVLIIYDITDNKTRNKMVACLEKYGVRVQKSAFEAYITKRKYHKLMQEVPFLIDTDTDSLRIYLLDSYMAVHSWGRGDTHTEDVIIL